MIIKKARPLFTKIITTADKYSDEGVRDAGGLIDMKKVTMRLKEFQRVVAVGDCVRNIKIGDLVMIDPSRYAVKKYKEDSLRAELMTLQDIGFLFPMIIIDGKENLVLEDRDIKMVIEECEEDD